MLFPSLQKFLQFQIFTLFLIWIKSATSQETEKRKKMKREGRKTLIHVQGLFLPFIKVIDLTTVVLPILCCLFLIFSFSQLLIASALSETFQNVVLLHMQQETPSRTP